MYVMCEGLLHYETAVDLSRHEFQTLVNNSTEALVNLVTLCTHINVKYKNPAVSEVASQFEIAWLTTQSGEVED